MAVTLEQLSNRLKIISGFTALRFDWANAVKPAEGARATGEKSLVPVLGAERYHIAPLRPDGMSYGFDYVLTDVLQLEEDCLKFRRVRARTFSGSEGATLIIPVSCFTNLHFRVTPLRELSQAEKHRHGVFKRVPVDV